MTVATHFPKISGIGGIDIEETLSGGWSEGLDGVILACEISSCAIVMVVGGILVARVGVIYDGVVDAWMIGVLDVDSDVVLVVDLEVAEGDF